MAALPRDEIDRLPVEERLRLVDDIWESIRAHPETLPVTDVQRAELDRRLAAHATDPSATTDVKGVMARLRDEG